MTGGQTGQIAQLLLGICAGSLLAMAAAMLRAPRASARWTGFAFFLSSAFFAVKLWADETQALPHEVRIALGIIAMSSVGWFWLMVMALFQDCDKFRPWAFAAPAAMTLCGIANQIGVYQGLGALAPVLWLFTSGLQVTLAVMSLWIVVRSWNDDLVESRRRVRGPFMVTVALYILSLNGFDIWEIFGDTPAWYPMFNAAMLTVCTLAGAFVFLDSSAAMFGEERTVAPAPPLAARPAMPAIGSRLAANGNGAAKSPEDTRAALDRASKADLDRLECLMAKDHVWREEGLTIASLALRAAMPETQLRRLINDCLGYRNFPSYVNAHRIAAAKSRLADPNESRVSISAIAYDIGFASLGPFNRAFKEETGASPSEWRRKSLGETSPIPETA
jgi:AraC-like DNA-binding protein